jgi:DNA-directed RNA polymerase subunit RPC12/RpoP
MTEERRKKDRRINDRRNPHYICEKCESELIYLLPTKLLSNECYECKGCGQKYVVLKFKGARDQLARVNNV